MKTTDLGVARRQYVVGWGWFLGLWVLTMALARSRARM
jgi:hypothetical protein